MKRLDLQAETNEEAIQYLEARSLQMLRHGVELRRIEVRERVLTALMRMDGVDYQALYMTVPNRGQGVFHEEFGRFGLPILTSVECHIEDFLIAKEIPHKTLVLEDSREYQLIQEVYGDQRAERSGAYLMNHIDEGRAVLAWRDAPEVAHKAFCLHPLVQADTDLQQQFPRDWTGVDPQAMIAAMEYRFIANDYLSKRPISSLKEVRRSVLDEVMEMLVADKVQNRKDFERYHEGKHPRSDELKQYFLNWMKVLGISEDQYEAYVQRLTLTHELITPHDPEE